MLDGTVQRIPKELKAKDLLESYWFVDEDLHVIIENTLSGEEKKEQAYYFPILTDLTAKSINDSGVDGGKQKREVLLFGKHQVDRKFYHFWPTSLKFSHHANSKK